MLDYNYNINVRLKSKQNKVNKEIFLKLGLLCLLISIFYYLQYFTICTGELARICLFAV